MTSDRQSRLSRRDYLRRGIGVTALAVGLAGCSGDGGSGGDGDDGTTSRTVEVGPNDEFVFAPGTDSPLRIAPGTTVEWVWESDTHNIVVREQPDDADWPGYEEIEDEGFTYEYTFEVPGEYHYVCEPHEAAGMVADIVVEE